jgi:hypothetical protein
VSPAQTYVDHYTVNGGFTAGTELVNMTQATLALRLHDEWLVVRPAGHSNLRFPANLPLKTAVAMQQAQARGPQLTLTTLASPAAKQAIEFLTRLRITRLQPAR